MTQRKTLFTEPQFRTALKRQFGALLEGRTTYQRSLDWLHEIRIGLGPLPRERIALIAGSIKLLLFSLRAEAGRAGRVEVKPSSLSSIPSSNKSTKSTSSKKGTV